MLFCTHTLHTDMSLTGPHSLSFDMGKHQLKIKMREKRGDEESNFDHQRKMKKRVKNRNEKPTISQNPVHPKVSTGS